MYITAAPKDEKKKEQKTVRQVARGHGLGGWAKVSPTDRRRRLAPLTGAPEGDQPLSRPIELTSGAGEYGNILFIPKFGCIGGKIQS
jgi:hypothetical protein